jgi:hypothetical protein
LSTCLFDLALALAFFLGLRVLFLPMIRLGVLSGDQVIYIVGWEGVYLLGCPVVEVGEGEIDIPLAYGLI